MKSAVLHIALLFLISNSLLFTQEENHPTFQLAYFDDFTSYKSFPSMCVDDVYEDSTGKLWLRTCGGSKQLSAYLYSFDGYEFNLAKGEISGIGKDITISGAIGDILYGNELHEDGHKYFTFNLLTDDYTVYDSTLNSRTVEQQIQGDTLYSYIEYDDRIRLELRSKDTVFNFELEKQEYCHTKEYGLDHLFLDYQLWSWNDQQKSYCQSDLRTAHQKNVALASVEEIFSHNNSINLSNAFGFFRDYVLKFDLDVNQKVRLYQQFLKREYPIKLTLRNKVERLFSAYEDQHGRILSVEDSGGIRKVILKEKNNRTIDLSEIFSELSIKSIRNIIADDFLQKIFVCHENGFAILKLRPNDTFEPVHLGLSTRTLTELPDKRILINTQQARQWQFDETNKEVDLFEGKECNILSNYFIKRTDNEYWSSFKNELNYYRLKTDRFDFA